MNKSQTHLSKVCLEGKKPTIDEATRRSYEENGNIDRVIGAATIEKAQKLESAIRKILGREIKSEFILDKLRNDGRGELLVEMTFAEAQMVHSDSEILQIAMS